ALSVSAVSSVCFASVFFFQAEDGIRDRNVTGVQTCALPISCLMNVSPETLRAAEQAYPAFAPALREVAALARRGGALVAIDGRKIGRASCRERGESSGGGVSVKGEGAERSSEGAVTSEGSAA